MNRINLYAVALFLFSCSFHVCACLEKDDEGVSVSDISVSMSDLVEQLLQIAKTVDDVALDLLSFPRELTPFINEKEVTPELLRRVLEKTGEIEAPVDRLCQVYSKVREIARVLNDRVCLNK